MSERVTVLHRWGPPHDNPRAYDVELDAQGHVFPRGRENGELAGAACFNPHFKPDFLQKKEEELRKKKRLATVVPCFTRPVPGLSRDHEVIIPPLLIAFTDEMAGYEHYVVTAAPNSNLTLEDLKQHVDAFFTTLCDFKAAGEKEEKTDRNRPAGAMAVVIRALEDLIETCPYPNQAVLAELCRLHIIQNKMSLETLSSNNIHLASRIHKVLSSFHSIGINDLALADLVSLHLEKAYKFPRLPASSLAVEYMSLITGEGECDEKDYEDLKKEFASQIEPITGPLHDILVCANPLDFVVTSDSPLTGIQLPFSFEFKGKKVQLDKIDPFPTFADSEKTEVLTGTQDLKIEGDKGEIGETVYFVPQISKGNDYQINTMLTALIVHGDIDGLKFLGKFPKATLDPLRNSSIQCIGTTTRNKRCKNKTLHPSSYCHLHIMQCMWLK